MSSLLYRTPFTDDPSFTCDSFIKSLNTAVLGQQFIFNEGSLNLEVHKRGCVKGVPWFYLTVSQRQWGWQGFIIASSTKFPLVSYQPHTSTHPLFTPPTIGPRGWHLEGGTAPRELWKYCFRGD